MLPARRQRLSQLPPARHSESCQGSCGAQGPASPWARAQLQQLPSPKTLELLGSPSCLLTLCSPQGYPGPAGDRGRPGRRGDKVGLGNVAQQLGDALGWEIQALETFLGWAVEASGWVWVVSANGLHQPCQGGCRAGRRRMARAGSHIGQTDGSPAFHLPKLLWLVRCQAAVVLGFGGFFPPFKRLLH